MFKYSNRSLEALNSCDPDIQIVFYKAIRYIDITIIEGARNEERQNELYADNKSKASWPMSKHNVIEPDPYSMAIDAAPYNSEIKGIDWRTDLELFHAINLGNAQEIREIVENIKRWKVFIGLILGIAAAYNVPLYNGSDWDHDFKFDDQIFIDSPHFEIRRG